MREILYTGIALISGWLGYLGITEPVIYSLIVAMAVDTLTGTVAGSKKEGIQSGRFIDGLLKRSMLLVVILGLAFFFKANDMVSMPINVIIGLFAGAEILSSIGNLSCIYGGPCKESDAIGRILSSIYNQLEKALKLNDD